MGVTGDLLLILRLSVMVTVEEGKGGGVLLSRGGLLGEGFERYRCDLIALCRFRTLVVERKALLVALAPSLGL